MYATRSPKRCAAVLPQKAQGSRSLLDLFAMLAICSTATLAAPYPKLVPSTQWPPIARWLESHPPLSSPSALFPSVPTQNFGLHCRRPHFARTRHARPIFSSLTQCGTALKVGIICRLAEHCCSAPAHCFLIHHLPPINSFRALEGAVE